MHCLLNSAGNHVNLRHDFYPHWVLNLRELNTQPLNSAAKLRAKRAFYSTEAVTLGLLKYQAVALDTNSISHARIEYRFGLIVEFYLDGILRYFGG